MATEIFMPKIGLNMREGLLVEWLVKDGQTVKKGDALFVVETDKVTNEITAETDGIVKISFPAGEMAPVAAVVGYILAPGEVMSQVPTDTEVGRQEPVTIENLTKTSRQQIRVLATPAARRRASELQIDLAMVAGTGPEGRISVEDVEAFAVKAVKKPAEQVIKATPVARRMAKELGIDLTVIVPADGSTITRKDVEKTREYALQPELNTIQPVLNKVGLESISMSPTRALIAERMTASSRETAAVTLITEVDASELYDLRAFYNRAVSKSGGNQISYDALLVKLASIALQEHDYMNVRYQDGVIMPARQIEIGVALDTPRGLVVPVVKDVLRKSVVEITADLQLMNARALDGKALPEDFEGGTFTITNLGMYGIDGFTPIIKLPEVAILGVGRIVSKPAEYQGAIALRKRMTLSLTFDHRLIDGAPAARFLQRLANLIEHPGLVLIKG